MAWGNLGDEYADLSNDDNLPQDERAATRAQALECYAMLIELAPEQPIAHYKWASVEQYDGDLQGAQRELQTALSLEPDFTPAMDSMGNVLMQMHKPDAAMAYYRKAIELDPRFAEARYDYGSA